VGIQWRKTAFYHKKRGYLWETVENCGDIMLELIILWELKTSISISFKFSSRECFWGEPGCFIGYRSLGWKRSAVLWMATKYLGGSGIKNPIATNNFANHLQPMTYTDKSNLGWSQNAFW